MSGFSIKILFLTLSVIGICCIPFLSYKLIPDNTYPSLQISYTWLDASQNTIENKVTSKLEGAFSTMKGVKKIYSRSYADYGEIFLGYDKSIDIVKERFNVSAIIRQIYPGLPKQVSYPKISYQRPNDDDIRLLNYSIVLHDGNQDIEKFINKTLIPNLTRNENISSIKVEGVPSYYYEIQYDVDQIKSLNISKNEIKLTLENALISQSLGNVISNIGSSPKEYLIMYKSIITKEDLYNLPVKKIDSKVIKVKDIASLKKRSTSNINLFRINGLQTISFSVIADRKANQIRLGNLIKESIKELDLKYSDYDFVLTNDTTTYLKEELKNIFYRTLLSFFFLFLFSLIIYRNLQYILSLFLSLIITLLTAVIFFKIFEIDIHIYSLMSLSISIGFVIDNTIIMIDHYSRNRNKKIILPIFAATITTVAPLILIAFLDDSIKLNLIDFSWVLIIVLISSLIVSFFLTPTMIKPTNRTLKRWNRKKLKKLLLFNKYYLKIIFLLRRVRVQLSLVLLFVFGIPLFLLPEKIDEDSPMSSLYNSTFGSKYYSTKIKPVADTYFGGVLKLFVENTIDESFMENPERIGISVRIKTPFGSTVEYIDRICNKLERSLIINKSLGIDFFQTNIHNERGAQIDVYFQSGIKSDFPYRLKGFLEQQILTMSGVNFAVFGIGKPFRTSSGESYDSRIVLNGYDYKKLNEYASVVSKRLEQNTRVENITLQSEPSWFSNTKKKYFTKNINFQTKRILENFYDNFSLKEIGNYRIGNNKIPLKLSSNTKNKNSSYNILNNQFYVNDSVFYKPKHDIKFNLTKVPDKIVKNNQQYQLVLQYEFKGTYKHSKIVKKEIVDEFKSSFISGFSIKDGDEKSFNSSGKRLYIPIVLCIFIIFSICTILLESFKKSLLIISVIPITFIGIFISLYGLNISFSSGVYGALILLVGLLVNSSIFIINEYTIYTKKLNSGKSYIKAFNKKIVPVVITIASTIVGLIPFLISDSINNFWYPFAITICVGLFFSMLTIVIVLPIYIISSKYL